MVSFQRILIVCRRMGDEWSGVEATPGYLVGRYPGHPPLRGRGHQRPLHGDIEHMPRAKRLIRLGSSDLHRHRLELCESS